MWKMEIVSQDEVVAEHVGVTVTSRDLWIPDSRSVAQGYFALDRNGERIESVCADHGEDSNMKLTDEGLVIIRGMWAHYEDGGEPHDEAAGYYYGVLDEAGALTKVDELPLRWSDPRLHREWNLRWLEGEGAPAPIPSEAAAVETPAKLEAVELPIAPTFVGLPSGLGSQS